MLEAKAGIARPASEDHKVYSTPFFAPFRLKAAGKYVENVIDHAEMFGADLDAPGWSRDRVESLLDGISYIAYTTTKSKPEHSRWRIIIRCSREYSNEEHSSLFKFVNELFNGELDFKCRNINRIFYVAAIWEGADNQFFYGDGKALPVSEIVPMYPPEPVVVVPQVTVLTGDLPEKERRIITNGMEATYGSSPPGGRFWKMMVSAAVRFKSNGWPLSAKELADAAVQVSLRYEPSRKRVTPEREAARVISYVEANVQTKSSLDRVRDKLLRKEFYRKKMAF